MLTSLSLKNSTLLLRLHFAEGRYNHQDAKSLGALQSQERKNVRGMVWTISGIFYGILCMES